MADVREARGTAAVTTRSDRAGESKDITVTEDHPKPEAEAVSPSDPDWRRYYGEVELGPMLVRVWDPIGVYGSGRNVSEYYDYVGAILDALEAGASASELGKVLIAIESETIGVPDPGRGTQQAAATIVAWYRHAMSRLDDGG